MAISDTLNSIKENLTNAYNALENKGAKIPEQKNIQNLAETATSISVGEYNIESVLNEDGTQTLNITHKDYREFYETFADNTPQQIAKASAKISANNLTSAQVKEQFGWSIGDTVPITLSSGEQIEMQIIGVNHDDKADESGKAGLTLQMVNCLETTYAFNNTATNDGGYPASVIRTSTLPTIKALLPQEWQDVIKTVNKKSANGSQLAGGTAVNRSEDLFLLSAIEVLGTYGDAQDGYNEGIIYEYWNGKTNTQRIKTVGNNPDMWLLRSVVRTTRSSSGVINASGELGFYMANYNRGVSFAFCI